ncbi:hypothetical protein DPMN_181370 [Dreissena polymorpha]|uniref:Uncharacterized protein n=2 Tax=Dreissena polymorpha TaxID=45954 RepID=A0A9D4I590_DREPO|nr:hypothetical protein DPMN_181370 [Dreissena polymorpha]
MTLTFTQRVQNEEKSEIVISSILQTSSIIKSPHIQTRTVITNHNHNVLSTQMQPITVSKSCSDWSSNCVDGVIVDMPPGSEEPEVPKGPPNDTANKEGQNFPWVAVVFGILGLVIIATVVVTTVSVLRRKRKRASRTLRNSPDEVIDFDREHFSVQPEFTNPSYGIEHDDDDGIKHDIYVVND